MEVQTELKESVYLVEEETKQLFPDVKEFEISILSKKFEIPK